MSSFNKVILMGNLTRDPAVKFLADSKAVCEFGVATNRRWKTASGEDKEEVCFVDCTAFGKTAEIIGEHFTKGKAILVDGRLKFDQWEGKDGSKRSKLTVVVDSFQFVGSKDDGGGQGAPVRERARSPVSAEPMFEKADIPF
jgi:single-strand DNA-binding protein